MDDSEDETGETEPLVKSEAAPPPLKSVKRQNQKPTARHYSGMTTPAADNSTERLQKDGKTEKKLSNVYKLDLDSTNKKIKNPSLPSGGTSPSLFCPIFGVKNYLHQFYEKTEVKNPSIYENLHEYYVSETGDTVYLVKEHQSGCKSSVFRLSLVLGGMILAMGVVAFTVAACSSRKQPLIGQVHGVPVVDKLAAAHNAEVDALLLVGLVAFTLGSTVIVSALISRTFCISVRDDYSSVGNMGVLGTSYCTIDERVPVTERLTTLQPFNKPGFLTVRPILP